MRAALVVIACAACADDEAREPPPCLADAFGGAAIDYAQWRAIEPGSPIQLELFEERLAIVLAPNATARNGLVSQRMFDLTGGNVVVAVDSTSGPRGPQARAGLELAGAGASFSIALEQGVLYARVATGGAVDEVMTPYDFGNHRRWRVRHDAAAELVQFETTSYSAEVWTAVHAVRPTTAVTSLSIALFGETYDFGNQGPGRVGFDDVRLTSAACP